MLYRVVIGNRAGNGADRRGFKNQTKPALRERPPRRFCGAAGPRVENGPDPWAKKTEGSPSSFVVCRWRCSRAIIHHAASQGCDDAGLEATMTMRSLSTAQDPVLDLDFHAQPHTTAFRSLSRTDLRGPNRERHIACASLRPLPAPNS